VITSFDLQAYIESRLQVSRRYGQGEMMLRECPNCGKRDHCSVNPGKRRWNCYSCGWGGGSRRDEVERFVAKVESCSLPEAREIILSSNLDFRRPDELEKILQAQEVPKPTPKPSTWRDHMPPEYIPCFDRAKGKWNGIPNYLVERGITKETCALYKLGWCDTGRYAHRIIIPISTGDLISFQARATWSDAQIRYDSPPDAPISETLMGYDMLKPGEEVWLVEGPFDKLACHQAEIPAVPLIGSQISDTQLGLLLRLRPAWVHVMLDPDAEFKARKVAARVACFLPTNLVCLEGGDPGDLGLRLKEQAFRFEDAERPRLSKLLTMT